MLVIFLLACGVLASEAIVCTPDFCSKVTCTDVSKCQGTLKPKGGICGCCDICVNLLGESERCSTSFLLGVPSTSECGPGLYCNFNTGTCSKLQVIRETVSGKCTKRKQELKKVQGSLLGGPTFSCLPDGSYNPVQCMGSVCYCVDDDGVEIKGYGTNIGQSASMNCQCARDKKSYVKSGLIGQQFNCDDNGNYRKYRCEGSVCSCVDKNGSTVGTQSVGIGQLSDLKC